MAEGGDLIDFENANPGLDKAIDNDGDEDESEVNKTRPFYTPQQTSTPYHVGEQVQMQTVQHEKSGMPSYLKKKKTLSAKLMVLFLD